MTDTGKPSLFISYSRDDAKYADALYKHLHAFRTEYGGDVFMDRNVIQAGKPWPPALQQGLESARAFAVLISSNFFNSDFCYKEELPKIIARYKKGEAAVFLILVSPYKNWTEYRFGGAKLGDVQAAGPFDEKGRPVWLSQIADSDAALTAIVEKIHKHFALDSTGRAASDRDASGARAADATSAAPELTFEKPLPTDWAASQSAIVIAIDEANDRIPEEQLLRAERHMTVTLSPKQIEVLENITLRLQAERSIPAIAAHGVDAFRVLTSAQDRLKTLLRSAKGARHLQPIAWTGKAALLVRIHRAILASCIDPNEGTLGFVSVGYGSHYFHPLHESGAPGSMQKRQGATDAAAVRIATVAVGDAHDSEAARLSKIVNAVSAEVVILSAPDVPDELVRVADLVRDRSTSATRVVVGLGAGDLAPEVLQKTLSRLPAISVGGPGLLRDDLVNAMRELFPEALRVQAVATAVAFIRNEVLKHAHDTGDATLFRDALFWTTWSWVGRPLFATQFGDVIPASYPHLMALRSIASKDWYFNRTEGIPSVYTPAKLIESGDDPESHFHLYLSGAGGTGKSCFLRYIYETLLVNKKSALPVWYTVDAPSSEWDTVQTRIKEEVQQALEQRLGKRDAEGLIDSDKDLEFFLTELMQNLRERGSSLDELFLFIDQLERTFESGENPELFRLERISKKIISLLDTVGVGRGVRVFIASRKQYLPDFLGSFQKASDNHLHFNVLHTIANDNEQVEFVQQTLRWCKDRGLVDKGVQMEEEAAKELSNAVVGHPLNMMLALIHVFSQGLTGRIGKKEIEQLKPWEKRFYIDEQLAAKDEIDWYFLLAMAHARTEIVRFEEVWWRLRLVSPGLTERVDDLGRQGVLERLWLMSHLGRTIYARPLDTDRARFLEFFHANLRDHLITTIMSYGGERVGLAGRMGTPAVWRALDRLTAAARDWKQSQQLLLRDDVNVLMQQKDVFVEPINKEGRAEEVPAFYLLFLRDSQDHRDELFEAAKECFVYSALVHDLLGRWAFKQLFRNVADQVDRCQRWLQRCAREHRLRILQYLIELRDVRADTALAELVFTGSGTADDVWQQLADILSEPLYAARYRRSFAVALLEHMVSRNVAFPADNAWTSRFGEFCAAACRADRDELLELLETMSDSVATLQNNALQAAIDAVLQQEARIGAWLEAAASGTELTAVSRHVQDAAPPRLELRVGPALRSAVSDDLVRDWHRQISDRVGLPVPPLVRSHGELHDIDAISATGYELQLLIEGRIVASGEFWPDSVQTLKRHWDIAGHEPPTDSRRSYNEALQESVVWLKKDRLGDLGWTKPSWTWDQAIVDWIDISVRQQIHNVFTPYDLGPFLHALWSAADARLNQREFYRTIAGNFTALWIVLTNLAREGVPLSARTPDLMVELQELVRQTGQSSTTFLTQKLREHVGLEICKRFTDAANQLPVLLMDAALEKELIERLRIADARHALDLTVDQSLTLASAVRGAFETVLRTEDKAPVLVCEDAIRLPLFRMIQHFDSRIHVLSYTELSPEVRPVSRGMVSAESLAAGV